MLRPIRVLLAGSTFAGYRLEEVAGRGGMAVVCSAWQIRPSRLVVLKGVTPELAEDVGFRARFERESELVASVEHPNVIPIYEAMGRAADLLDAYLERSLGAAGA